MTKIPLASLSLACALALTTVYFRSGAAILYVDPNSANPTPPYSDWSTAATTIQDAVDAASPGDQVLVTNGIYATGGRTAVGALLTNRVTIDQAITVQSVNGPGATVIHGYQMPGVTNGTSAIRCVYLTNNAVLIGFTLTNGSTWDSTASGSEQIGGGIDCKSISSVVSNCVIVGNAAAAMGGGASSGNLYNCTILNNCATNGGGCYASILNKCLVETNLAYQGAGAYSGRLTNCAVIGNSASFRGGGASSPSALERCFISGNSAQYGGGISAGVACSDSVLVGNSAQLQGGGAYAVDLNNCTVVSNRASSSAGGAYANHLVNCILFYNNASVGSDAYGAYLTNCCTSSTNSNAAQYCITNPPAFVNLPAGDFHLQSRSPCINTGSNAFAGNLDLDGNPRIVGASVDIGAYEYQHPLRFVNLNNPSPFTPYTTWPTAATNIQNAIDVATNGDLILVSNGIYYSGGRVTRGYLTNRVAVTKAITLQSLNGPGVTAIEGFNGVSTAPYGPFRCVYLTNGAALIGFTLTNGGTQGAIFGSGAPPPNVNTNFDCSGGGAWCEDLSVLISNCTFINNVAALDGGGAHQGTIFNCLFTGNEAFFGGAAASNVLNNCLLSGNSAFYYVINSVTNSGKGNAAFGALLNNCTIVSNLNVVFGPPNSAVASCTLNNSILYFNTNSANGPNPNFTNSTLNFCCTMPLPSTGTNNITNNPGFIDPAAGNFRLLGNSRCINAGQNSLVSGNTDFDGNPRIRGGTVDIGAYEFQADVTGTFATWLQQNSLPTDGSADFLDSDGDGMNNWQEWFSGTDPANALSVLQLLTPVPTNSTSILVSWQSVAGRNYYLQSSTNLSAQPAFTTIQSNIVGQPVTTSYMDAQTAGNSPHFYRVGVQ